MRPDGEVLRGVVERADPALVPAGVRRALLDLCMRGAEEEGNQTAATRWGFATAFVRHARGGELLELAGVLADTNMGAANTEDAKRCFAAVHTACAKLMSSAGRKTGSQGLSAAALAAAGATAWWPLSTDTTPGLGNVKAHAVGEVRFPRGPRSPSRHGSVSSTLPGTGTGSGAYFPPSSFLAVPYSPVFNPPTDFSVEVQVKVLGIPPTGQEHVFLSSHVAATRPSEPPKGWEVAVARTRGGEAVFTFRAGEDAVSARLVLPSATATATATATSTSTSTEEDWIHVQCCRSPSRLYLVLNGGESSREAPVGTTYKPNTDAPLYIGSAPSAAAATTTTTAAAVGPMPSGMTRFQGYLANVVLYRECLVKGDTSPRSTGGGGLQAMSSPTAARPSSLVASSPPSLTPRDTFRFMLQSLTSLDGRVRPLGEKAVLALLSVYHSERVSGDEATQAMICDALLWASPAGGSTPPPTTIPPPTWFHALLDMSSRRVDPKSERNAVIAVLQSGALSSPSSRVMMVARLLCELVVDPVRTETMLRVGTHVVCRDTGAWDLWLTALFAALEQRLGECGERPEPVAALARVANEACVQGLTSRAEAQCPVLASAVLRELLRVRRAHNVAVLATPMPTTEDPIVTVTSPQTTDENRAPAPAPAPVPALAPILKSLAWNLVLCYVDSLAEVVESGTHHEARKSGSTTTTSSSSSEEDDVLHLTDFHVVVADEAPAKQDTLAHERFERVRQALPLPPVHRARFAGKAGEQDVWRTLKAVFELLCAFGVEETTAWKSSWSLLSAITSRRQQDVSLGPEVVMTHVADTVEEACALIRPTPESTTPGMPSLLMGFLQACVLRPAVLDKVKQAKTAWVVKARTWTRVLQWCVQVMSSSDMSVAEEDRDVLEYLLYVVSGAPALSVRDSFAGPALVQEYERSRRAAVVACLESFWGETRPVATRPPVSTALRLALRANVLDSEGDSRGCALVFALVQPLLLLGASPMESPLLRALDANADNEELDHHMLEDIPTTAGFQWRARRRGRLVENKEEEDDDEVQGDGLRLHVPLSQARRRRAWAAQPRFHVGTHGMLSGVFYVEMALLQPSQPDDLALVVLGLSSRPDTEMFDCGCRLHVGKGVGVGMLVDLTRGVVTYYAVPSTEVQPAHATRKIFLQESEQVYTCEVSTVARPLYMACAVVSEGCDLLTVFAENAEEQVEVVQRGFVR